MRNTRLVLAVALLGLAVAQQTKAGPGGCTNDGSLTPFAFETLTVSSTALPFTVLTAFPLGLKGADLAVAVVETDSIRTRTDGQAPSATVGQIIVATSTAPASFTVCGELSIRRTRMIRVTTDATVSVMFYRRGDQ